MTGLDLAGRLRALSSRVRFGRFLSVGVLGAVCDTAVLVGLTTLFAVPAEIAKLAGAEAAIVLMFVANERWTFAGEGADGRSALARRFLTSNAVRAGGVVVATVVLSVVLRIGPDVVAALLGRPAGPVLGQGAWLVVANAAGIGAGVLVNYALESTVTWDVTDVSE